MEERKGKKIIMFPLPFPGHFKPMIQLAGIFHKRGFSITILHTSFNSPDPSHFPNFTFRTIHHKYTKAKEEEEDPLSHPESLDMDLVAFISLLKQSYAEPFLQSFTAELSGGQAVCCLISDAVWGEVASVEIRTPRLVLSTNGAASFCAYAAFPLLRDKDYLPIKESRLDELVIELPPLKVKDLPVMETNEPEELYRVVNNMVKGAKTSSGVIWNTFEDLERLSLMDFSSKLQVPIFPIGPFYKHINNVLLIENKEDHLITEWLNKQEPKSVVYVSFGSLADIEEKELLDIAWGLRNSEIPFLWVVRPGLVKGKEWLDSLPCGFVENIGQKGKFVKWVNQLEVLAHPSVGVFWTHCGWNSTLESICEGVPMICTPCFTDQRVNAKYIVDVWQVGMMLERSNLDRKEIENLVRSVMIEKGGGLKEKCLELKEKANVCLNADGSSSKYLDKLVSHVLSFDS